MYVPDKFRESRVDVLHRCMGENPLGTIVYVGSEGLVADHIPFLVDPAPAPFGTLRGHMARGNAFWKECPADQDALVVFHGPNAYITPSWLFGKWKANQNRSLADVRGVIQGLSEEGNAFLCAMRDPDSP